VNNTDVKAPNPCCKPKLDINCWIWLVDWNVDPGTCT